MKKKTYTSYIESIYHNIDNAVRNDIAGSGSPWWGIAIGEKISTGAMLDEYYKALIADPSLSTEDKDHITALYNSYRNLYAAALDTASKSKEIIALDEAGYAKKEVASKIIAETSKATVLPPLKAEQIKADTEYSDKIVAMYQPIFQPGVGQGKTKIPVIENAANAVIRHIAAKTINVKPIIEQLISELQEDIKTATKDSAELVNRYRRLTAIQKKLEGKPDFVSIAQLDLEDRFEITTELEKVTLKYGSLYSLKGREEDKEKNSKWGYIHRISSWISEEEYNLAIKEIRRNSPKGTDLSNLDKLKYSAVDKAFDGVKSEEDGKKVMFNLVGTEASGLAAGAKSNPPPNFKGFDIVKWREETLKPLYSQKNLYSFMLDISARLRFIDTYPLEVVRYNAYADRAKSPEKYDALVSRENKEYWEKSNSLLEKFVNHYSENGISAGDLPKIKNYFELLIRSMSLEKMKYMLEAFDTDIKPSLPKINTIEVSTIKRSFFGALCNDPERQVELLKLLKKISINEIKTPIKRDTITKLSILDNKLTGIKTEQIKAFNLNNSLGNAMVQFSDIKDGDAKLEHLVKVIKRPNLYGALAYFSERSGGKGANMVEWFEGNVSIFDSLSGVKVDIGINVARNIAEYIDNKLIKDLPPEKKPQNISDDKIEILDATTHIRIAALVERCKLRSNIASSAFSDNPNLMVEIQTEIQKAASITSSGVFRKTYKLVIDEKMLEETLPIKFSAIAIELQKAALARRSSSARSEPPPPARFSSSKGATPPSPQGSPPPARSSSSHKIAELQTPSSSAGAAADRRGPPPPSKSASSRHIPVQEAPQSPTAVQIHMREQLPAAKATPVVAPVPPTTTLKTESPRAIPTAKAGAPVVTPVPPITSPKAVPPPPLPSRAAPPIPGTGKEEHPKTSLPVVTQNRLVTTTTKQAAVASTPVPKPAEKLPETPDDYRSLANKKIEDAERLEEQAKTAKNSATSDKLLRDADAARKYARAMQDSASDLEDFPPPPVKPAVITKAVQTVQTPVSPKLPGVPAAAPQKTEASGRLQIREQVPVKLPPAKPTSLSVNPNAPSTVQPKLSPGVEIGKPLPIAQRGAPPPSKSPHHATSHASRVPHKPEAREGSPGLEGLRRNSNIKTLIAAHEKDPKPIAPPKQPPQKHLPPARPGEKPGTKPTQPPPSGHWR